MFQMTHISMGQDMDKYKKTGEETNNLSFSKVSTISQMVVI